MAELIGQNKRWSWLADLQANRRRNLLVVERAFLLTGKTKDSEKDKGGNRNLHFGSRIPFRCLPPKRWHSDIKQNITNEGQFESRANPAPHTLPASASWPITAILRFRAFLKLRPSFMVRENPADLSTDPIRTMFRRTATCFSVLPAFSPPFTCDSSLSSATATKMPADSVVLEAGNGPVSIWRICVLSSLRLEEMLTWVFIPFVAFLIASLALRASLPTAIMQTNASSLERKLKQTRGCVVGNPSCSSLVAGH